MQHTVIPRSFLKSGKGRPHPPGHGPLGQSAPGHQAVPVAQQVLVLRSELATEEGSETESHIVVSKNVVSAPHVTCAHHTTPHHTTLHTTQEKVDFFRRWNVVWCGVVWCGVVWPMFCVHFSLPTFLKTTIRPDNNNKRNPEARLIHNRLEKITQDKLRHRQSEETSGDQERPTENQEESLK